MLFERTSAVKRRVGAALERARADGSFGRAVYSYNARSGHRGRGLATENSELRGNGIRRTTQVF
jgi:hypothetical protein